MEGLEQDTALVRELATFAKTNVAAIAKKARIAPSTLQRPANGSATTRLSQRTLEKLKIAYPDFPGWAGSAIVEADDRSTDMVEVAEIDPRFGLGNAFMDEPAAPELRTFSRTWLRQITTTPPEELYWARGRGNSMAPTIDDQEPVLIDRRQQTPYDADLIWAFAWGDVGAIKRLRPMPDGSVRILSDNPSVPAEVAHDGEIHIFGRVIAVVKNI